MTRNISVLSNESDIEEDKNWLKGGTSIKDISDGLTSDSEHETLNDIPDITCRF